MNTFFSAHSAFVSILTFDAVVGLVVFWYYRSIPLAHRHRLVPIAVGIIAGLINISGLFCPPWMVEMLAVFGWFPLYVWLLGDVAEFRGRKLTVNPIVHPEAAKETARRLIRTEVMQRHKSEMKRAGSLGQLVLWFRIEREIAQEMKRRFPPGAFYVQA